MPSLALAVSKESAWTYGYWSAHPRIFERHRVPIGPRTHLRASPQQGLHDWRCPWHAARYNRVERLSCCTFTPSQWLSNSYTTFRWHLLAAVCYAIHPYGLRAFMFAIYWSSLMTVICPWYDALSDAVFPRESNGLGFAP